MMCEDGKWRAGVPARSASFMRTSPKNTTVWNIEAARTRSRQVATKPHSAGNNEETANPLSLRQRRISRAHHVLARLGGETASSARAEIHPV